MPSWRTSLAAPAVALTALAATPFASAVEPPLLGFTPESSVQQRALEARFDAAVRRTDIHDYLERLARRPHHLGSPYDKDNAEWMAGLFRSWGYDTRIETFDVLFPTPKTRLVEMTAPRLFRASLTEPPLAEDSTSGQTAEQLPTYNAYSIDGDVTGDLVYVNYGVPEDYEELERRGIDVKGKLVIARYGKSWRGIKPKVAAEKGAVGCLIYSDPRDDGYFEGDAYPKGGFRPDAGAQRGSVADMPLYPGDPLTPGVGATAEAERLPREKAATITKIPVLPISWADARPLLEALSGPVAPEPWRGALPITYHLGPGPAKVHLQLAFDWKRVPARDVIAVLKGAEEPDQWVIRGNHHDAWVNGATDPSSGMAAVLAEAKALSELVRQGFTPRRTIVYAAWDGEEPGLIGSTEWVETHARELEARAVAYINSDSNSRGYLSMEGSHSLQRLVNEVARDVSDPVKGVSAAERLRDQALLGSDADDRRRALARDEIRLDALGSGSDYTPFLQHVGIASINIGFGGEGRYGQYHSIYDSFDHYVRFMDPDFAYGAALAKVGGRSVLRLAQAELLPFEFTAVSAAVGGYLDEIDKLANDMRAETERFNEAIARGAFEATAPPDETRVTPARKEPVPHLNFAPLRNAAERLQQAARDYERALASAGPAAPPAARREANKILLQAERAFTRPEGLAGRPWFRHAVYAPGFYTGYGVKTLPLAREAVEARRFGDAEKGVAVTAEAIQAYAAAVESAAKALAPGAAK
jgi:N-acetylated-alpha-linked acidic dipeptidase